MTDVTSPSSHTLHLDLLDIQKNLNALVRQLNRHPQKRCRPQGAAALMVAMAYKLTQLSHRVQY